MVGTFAGAAVLTLLGLVVAIFGGPAGGIAFMIAAVLVWVGLALLYFYRRMTVYYRLTTYRFFHETGLLSRVGNRVEVIDIDDARRVADLIDGARRAERQRRGLHLDAPLEV
jgi:hypothetical protein